MIDTTKPVDRTGNTFCGPLVVAAILGTSTGAVVAEIAAKRQATRGVRLSTGKLRRVRARTADAIRGTYDTELFALLESRGVKLEPVDVGARYRPHRKIRGRPCYVNTDGSRFSCPLDLGDDWLPWTLLEREVLPLWRAALRLRDGATYIVHLPGHWAIVSGGKWCETYTRGEWLPLAAAPCRNRQVKAAWRVTT